MLHSVYQSKFKIQERRCQFFHDLKSLQNYVKYIMEYQDGLTFDDVLLQPGYSDFSRQDITLKTVLSKKIVLSTPLISAPMDTVTESALAIALAKLGGLGIIHRNLTVSKQADEVKKVKTQNLLVGAAVGVSRGFEERARALVAAGVDLIVLDNAHGYTNQMIDTLTWMKKHLPKIDIMAGNIATYDGAMALIRAGADMLRVGMGPGAICTTRIISGMGVPQMTALTETTRAAKKTKTPVIADGGIKYSGDMVKALAAGAAACMMGSFFASCEEAPGTVFKLKAQEIPSRFKNLIDANDPKKIYTFKTYRGMGSVGAMKKGADIKSEDEYHGKTYKDRVLVAEGVEGLVPVKGSVQQIIDQAVGGMKSGLFYVGAKSIPELQKKAKFYRITQASLSESHPHSIFVTNPGENYA
jgi:IMP dehydrogenase